MDRLTYIGHATTLIRLEGTTVLTDPMLRAGLGPLRRQGLPPPPALSKLPDAVLISHLHRDHLDIPSLRRVPSKTPLVVPRGASRLVEKAGRHPIVELGRGETISVGEVEVTAVPAEHGGRRGRWGSEIEPLGYVIRSERAQRLLRGRHGPVRRRCRSSGRSTWRCCRSGAGGRRWERAISTRRRRHEP